jgi:hypothetical protein
LASEISAQYSSRQPIKNGGGKENKEDKDATAKDTKPNGLGCDQRLGRQVLAEPVEAPVLVIKAQVVGAERVECAWIRYATG